MSVNLENKLEQIPKKTGVYHFLGEKRQVLYVGKAKDLRSRVKSYFRPNGLSKRIQMMVAQIEDLEWIITINEYEALVLENSHIKSLKPKFNILFRDDKSYPYLRFSNQQFSRVSYFRSRSQQSLRPNSQTPKKQDQCLGPYPNPSAVRGAIAIIQKAFGIRTCRDNIFKNRNRACLLHQIKRCAAPCVGLISEQDYQNSVALAIKFVTGKMPEVFEELEANMQNAATIQDYELAAKYRDQLQALRVTASSQRIIGEVQDNCDLIVAIVEDDWFALSYRAIRSGQPDIETHFANRNHFMAKANEVLYEFIRHQYLPMLTSANQDSAYIPPKIWLNLPAKELWINEPELITLPLGYPRSIREKEWIDRLTIQSKAVLEAEKNNLEQINLSLLAVQELIDLPVIPKKIECIDISHLGGKGTIGSWVVFINGKSANNLYRRYNIRNTASSDDYLAIQELITRRFSKLKIDLTTDDQGENFEANPKSKNEDNDLIPDLLIIDGGKGQLNRALEVIKSFDHPELSMMPIIGLAKGRERIAGEEKIVYQNLDNQIQETKSNITNIGFKLLLAVRDEAHRFAITGQRASRKKQNYSRLEDINGLGTVRRRKLISRFGSVQAVRNASREQLMQVDGISNALAGKILEELT